MKRSYLFIAMTAVIISCNSEKKASSNVGLITLDPGHFHAALVQKSMYEGVDSTVYVYGPESPDMQLHLGRINAYNNRAENPTHWKEDVYLGNDYLEKMLAEKKGNVVVLAGNNQHKTNYIQRSVNAGFNVLADKPMAIDAANFELLKHAFQEAAKQKVLLYDIMTERYEITNLLQRELAMVPGIFGELQKGTAAQPAIEIESVHYFYKYVSGSVLTRPAWFMDVAQQGEGIADVATHLVDLVQWGFFPEKIIDYTKDIQVDSARHWSTDMTAEQFTAITQQTQLPAYLLKDSSDGLLHVFANGQINYRLNGTFIKIIAKWDYKATEGGDTHYAMVRGTKANLVIRQGAAEKYEPTLFIKPASAGSINDTDMEKEFKKITANYEGVTLKKNESGWEVVIPDKYKEGHEAHFARVMEKYLGFLDKKEMPAWEVPNMLAKYYTTTRALEIAKSQNK